MGVSSSVISAEERRLCGCGCGKETLSSIERRREFSFSLKFSLLLLQIVNQISSWITLFCVFLVVGF